VERRALDRVSPLARLASAREQAGLLFERATRAVADRLAADRRPLDRAGEILPRLAAQRIAAARAALDASAAVLPRVAVQRLATARAALDASAAALTVLGPQATLDRGYAIVRTARDEAILRDPVDAAPGTDLRVRLARGELAARVTDPATPDHPPDA
jgi:exodeoxyribonuclease VII large subunit